jgi:hypothetical protein
VFAGFTALTGVVLTFREFFPEARPSAPTSIEPVDLDRLVARAVEVAGAPATDIGLALRPGDPYTVWIDDDAETEVYLDAQAQVLGTRAGRNRVGRWLFMLHTAEPLGLLGQIVMGATGLGLIWLAWSGVSMWWGRRKNP